MTNLEMLTQLESEFKKTFAVKSELLQDNSAKNFEELCNINEDAANEYEQIGAAGHTLHGYILKISSLLCDANSYVTNNLA